MKVTYLDNSYCEVTIDNCYEVRPFTSDGIDYLTFYQTTGDYVIIKSSMFIKITLK